jgi:formylglycine-generating enzyme required for sulfatase activity
VPWLSGRSTSVSLAVETAFDRQMHNRALSPESGDLSAYRQIIAEQVRYLSSARGDNLRKRVPLADVLIERRLVVAGAEPGGEISADGLEGYSLTDLVGPPEARILIVGEPGAGKTTCLQHLALACVANEENLPADLHIEWAGAAPLPLLLGLRPSAAPAQLDDQQLLGRLPLRLFTPGPVVEDLVRNSAPELHEALVHLLQSGGCLVLIDDTYLEEGADSMSGEAIAQLVERYPNNRYVATRLGHGAGTPPTLAGFESYLLAPLNDREVDALITRCCSATIDSASFTPEARAERVAVLQGALRGSLPLRRLVSNPLALMLYLQMYADDSLLPSRAAILQQLLELVLSRKGAAHEAEQTVEPEAYVSAEQQRILLQRQALAARSQQEAAGDQLADLGREQAEALLSQELVSLDMGQRRAAQEDIPALLRSWQLQGLLQLVVPAALYAAEHTSSQLWQSLHEYLVATALGELPDFPARAHGLRRSPHWRESLLLATHALAHDGALHAALALPRRLLDSSTSDDQGGEHDLLLAAECLVELGPHAESERTLRHIVCARLRELIAAPGCATAERIRVGLLLGYLDESPAAALLPQTAHIPAGAYLFGSRAGYEDEGPQQWVNVPSFAIGAYPVTNREYALFLAANPGYLRPHYWHDTRFNNPSQPVIGVTWDDASAYCGWLTRRLAEAGQLPAGTVVRLPLEVEWEKAASWDAKRRRKRRYPWGDEWSSANANTADDRGAWLTSPVGSYPQGVSAYGVHDMIGNVWEWTASEYASYTGAAVPFYEKGSYTLRGASCVSLPTHVRCTFRSRMPARYWRYHVGFRVVIAYAVGTLGEG